MTRTGPVVQRRQRPWIALVASIQNVRRTQDDPWTAGKGVDQPTCGDASGSLNPGVSNLLTFSGYSSLVACV